MDRMLYIAMSGAKQTMLAQSANSNNLANVSTHGFRQDFIQQRSMPVFGDGLPTRAYAMTERPAFNTQHGAMESTGRQLDMAIKDEGWIAVEFNETEEAFTRAGNMQIDEAGYLTTAGGRRVLGDAGPINFPSVDHVEIAADGTISVLPVGQDPSAMVVLDRIRLVNPDPQELYKDSSGLIRAKEGVLVDADPNVSLLSGSLETSNVNAVESLVTMIDLSRRYEMQVKMMQKADEAAAATTQMMRL